MHPQIRQMGPGNRPICGMAPEPEAATAETGPSPELETLGVALGDLAAAVGGKLGIDEIEAEVLPEDKHQVVRRLRSQGRAVAMAGDGVNDAPAMAPPTSVSPWAPAPRSPSRAPA